VEDASGVTAATWQWYSLMDDALQGQHSISLPLVVAENLSATTVGVVAALSSAPPKERAKPPPRKRTRFHDEFLEFLKQQAEREEERGRQALAREKERERQAVAREEERERQAVAREEERERQAVAREEARERAASQRAERYLSLFERLVDKV